MTTFDMWQAKKKKIHHVMFCIAFKSEGKGFSQEGQSYTPLA